MSKMLEIKANELEGVNVGWVALVHKGANRIPFRITKSDGEPTMDLYSLGRRIFKGAEPAKPTVVAAIVAKTANLEAAKTALTAAGLSVEKMSEQDDMIVFQQGEAPAADADTTVFKMDDNVALVCVGLKKMFSDYNFESMNFNEVMSQNGFWPSICVAKDMLSTTIDNIMWESNSAAVAKAAIDKAVADFSAYISGVTAALPEAAFKADVELSKADKNWTEGQKGKKLDDADDSLKKDKSKKEEISQHPNQGNETDTSKPGGGNDPNIEGKPAHGNETPPASGGKQPSPGGSADNNIEGKPAASKSDETIDTAATDESKEVPAGLAELFTGKLKEMQDSITATMKGETDKIAARMDKVEGRLAKTEEAVNGTVSVEPEADKTRTQKSAGHGAPPLLDTAFMKADSEAA